LHDLNSQSITSPAICLAGLLRGESGCMNTERAYAEAGRFSIMD